MTSAQVYQVAGKLFGENWLPVRNSCFCLDKPPVDPFVDTGYYTVYPGGGDLWKWAGTLCGKSKKVQIKRIHCCCQTP